MLPLDYPDDFEHGGLLDAWFRDVPWGVQRAVQNVDPRLRCIRNPATSVFVIVIKLNPEDPQQVYTFFGVARLVGWAPVAETRRGFPVEFVYQLCEGMQASAKQFDEQYGSTPESVAAGLRRDDRARDQSRVAAMMESTAFAKKFVREFQARSLAMSVSDAKGRRLYEQAKREFDQETRRRAAHRDGKPLVLVSR